MMLSDMEEEAYGFPLTEEMLDDPNQLLLPFSAPGMHHLIPTALIPFSPQFNNPWEDPRYAMPHLGSFYHPTLVQQPSGGSAVLYTTSPAATSVSAQPYFIPTFPTNYVQPNLARNQNQNTKSDLHQHLASNPGGMTTAFRPTNVPFHKVQPNTPGGAGMNRSGSSFSTSSNQHNANKLGVYEAVYSNVPVFELMCNGVAVMRRQADSHINATHILKVAGIEKGKRTKILEREIHTGVHEKVQGGYGKYQGTWIPLERARELAREYQVYDNLKLILETTPVIDPN